MKELTEDLKPLSPFRRRLHEIIFESDTKAGKFFDAALIAFVLLSISAVVIETIPGVETSYQDEIFLAEWFFTGLFTLEYFMRIFVVKKPWLYMRSFFGIIDLISVLPMYLSLVFVGVQTFLAIRILRLLRLFRIFKMARYVSAAQTLVLALKLSLPKIIVFLITIFSIVVIMGSAMYFVEGHVNPGMTSIPETIYWSIVTITTVGFGDIVPITVPGKVLASILMIIGFGVFAVPTGIVSIQLAKAMKLDSQGNQACQSCGRIGHDADAVFCKFCGGRVAG